MKSFTKASLSALSNKEFLRVSCVLNGSLEISDTDRKLIDDEKAKRIYEAIDKLALALQCKVDSEADGQRLG